MSISEFRGGRRLIDELRASGAAPDLAAAAALLQIGEHLGLIGIVGSGEEFSSQALAHQAAVTTHAVERYADALVSAGILRRTANDPRTYQAVEDFPTILHQAGYLSWAMVANRPFIDHAREFLTDPLEARRRYLRDGRQVAVSSQWMGSLAFYPAALEAILGARPSRLADLGSGTCRLLIEVLSAFPGSTGVGLDIDPKACEAARHAAEDAGVGERLTVHERPIQSIADDPSPLDGVDMVHAGFVLHDMLPNEEDVADRVLTNCRDAMPAGGIMAITDAIPWASNNRERRFSALVTYYHHEFMGRRLLTEDEWREKLRTAGFDKVECVELGFPTGRLFLAVK